MNIQEKTAERASADAEAQDEKDIVLIKASLAKARDENATRERVATEEWNLARSKAPDPKDDDYQRED